MPLTVATVKNAKPESKNRRLFDSGGLYLEVSPKGGKWWRFKYRFAGKEKRVSLGTYPDVGLRDAREKRDDFRKLLRDDIDPGTVRSARKRTGPPKQGEFEFVAREWFEKYYAAKDQTYAERVLRRLERDLFPWIGAKPIDEVSAPLLLSTLRRIEARGALETAQRARGNCERIFRYAIATGHGTLNPARDLVGALQPPAVTHHAAFTEPEKVAHLLREIDAVNGTFVVRSALQLAPLVIVRPVELRSAKWEDFDLPDACWRFAASTTSQEHIVPLSDQALRILRELHPATGRGVFLFPSTHGKGRSMSSATINLALRRMGFDTKTEMTGHGFRAMARTLLDEVLEFPPHLIEHQLAHRVRDPLGRAYNRTAHLPQRREMMQRWADYLDGLKGESARIQGHQTTLASAVAE